VLSVLDLSNQLGKLGEGLAAHAGLTTQQWLVLLQVAGDPNFHALPMNGFSTGTAQTQSFSEVAFSFRLTPAILITGMVFAALMGLVGGLLPALRAARMPITRALRDA